MPDLDSIPIDKDCMMNGPESDKLFCARSRNYPDKEYLTDLLEDEYPNLAEFFNEPIYPEEVSYRKGNEPGEESLCRSRTRSIYPEKAFNKDRDWLFIVNLPNYRQSVRIEECT